MYKNIGILQILPYNESWLVKYKWTIIKIYLNWGEI